MMFEFFDGEMVIAFAGILDWLKMAGSAIFGGGGGASGGKSSGASRSRSASDSYGYNRNRSEAHPYLPEFYGNVGAEARRPGNPYMGQVHPGMGVGHRNMMQAMGLGNANAFFRGKGENALYSAIAKSPYGQPYMQGGQNNAGGGAPAQTTDALNSGVGGLREMLASQQNAPANNFDPSSYGQYTQGINAPRYRNNADTPEYGGAQFQNSAQWNNIERQREQVGLDAFRGGTNALSQMAGGGTNPYLERQVAGLRQNMGQDFDRLQSGLNATFGGAGRTGSGAHAAASQRSASDFGDRLATAEAGMRGQAYESDRNRALSAAQGLGQLGLARHEGAENRNLGQYQTDVGARGQRYGIDRQTDLGRYNADMRNALGRYNADTSRYGMDRQADTARYQTDAGMYNANMRNALSRYQGDQSNAFQNRQLDSNWGLAQQQNRLDASRGLTDVGLRSQMVGNQGQQVANEAFRNQAQYQLGALGMMPQFMNSRLQDTMSMFNMGERQNALAQNNINRQMGYHNYLDNYNLNRLGAIGNIYHGAPMRSMGENFARSRSQSESTNKSGNFGFNWQDWLPK